MSQLWLVAKFHLLVRTSFGATAGPMGLLQITTHQVVVPSCTVKRTGCKKVGWDGSEVVHVSEQVNARHAESSGTLMLNCCRTSADRQEQPLL